MFQVFLENIITKHIEIVKNDSYEDKDQTNRTLWLKQEKIEQMIWLSNVQAKQGNSYDATLHLSHNWNVKPKKSLKNLRQKISAGNSI